MSHINVDDEDSNEQEAVEVLKRSILSKEHTEETEPVD